MGGHWLSEANSLRREASMDQKKSRLATERTSAVGSLRSPRCLKGEVRAEPEQPGFLGRQEVCPTRHSFLFPPQENRLEASTPEIPFLLASRPGPGPHSARSLYDRPNSSCPRHPPWAEHSWDPPNSGAGNLPGDGHISGDLRVLPQIPQ